MCAGRMQCSARVAKGGLAGQMHLQLLCFTQSPATPIHCNEQSCERIRWVTGFAMTRPLLPWPAPAGRSARGAHRVCAQPAAARGGAAGAAGRHDRVPGAHPPAGAGPDVDAFGYCSLLLTWLCAVRLGDTAESLELTHLQVRAPWPLFLFVFDWHCPLYLPFLSKKGLAVCVCSKAWNGAGSPTPNRNPNPPTVPHLQEFVGPPGTGAPLAQPFSVVVESQVGALRMVVCVHAWLHVRVLRVSGAHAWRELGWQHPTHELSATRAVRAVLQALLVADFHAHLSRCEVIGLLGGTFDSGMQMLMYKKRWINTATIIEIKSIFNFWCLLFSSGM